MGGLWRPASVYTLNRGRFHHLVFALRALLWLVAAVFAWGAARDSWVWGVWALLLVIGLALWHKEQVLDVLNQLFIVTDIIVISVAIHFSGGLASPGYLLYGGEAIFLTVYGTLRYSVAGFFGVILSYGLSSGGWDQRIFWWRMVVMGIYLLAAGGLGREYRLTRYKNRENSHKLDQLSQLKVLQESIVQDQSLNLVLSRLLAEARDMVRAPAAYIARIEGAERIVQVIASGVDLPSEFGVDMQAILPESFRVISKSESPLEWRWPIHQVLEAQGLTEVALIPLKSEEETYGWIGFATRNSALFLAAQTFIIQSLADVISTQIRFALAQSTAAKRGQLLAILERVGRIVNRNLDMGQLLRRLRQSVSEVLETDSFFVALTLSDDSAHALMQYLWDDGEEYPPEVFPIEPGGLTGSVIVTGKPLLLNGQDNAGRLTGSQKEPRGMLVVPLIYEGRVLGAMSTQSYRIEYDPDHLEFLSAIASQASIAIRNAQMYQQTQEIALTDYLTGLGNSRRFNMALQSAIEMSEESEQPLTLLLIDSDSLKSINDRFGHRAGDLHLQRVAQVIRESIREDDVPCRYAGDEFVIILPKSQLDDALQVGERIRHEIEGHRFQWTDTLTLGATISVGAATYCSGMTADMLFQAADHAMYHAKQSGKNRVASAQ